MRARVSSEADTLFRRLSDDPLLAECSTGSALGRRGPGLLSDADRLAHEGRADCRCAPVPTASLSCWRLSSGNARREMRCPGDGTKRLTPSRTSRRLEQRSGARLPLHGHAWPRVDNRVRKTTLLAVPLTRRPSPVLASMGLNMCCCHCSTPLGKGAMRWQGQPTGRCPSYDEARCSMCRMVVHARAMRADVEQALELFVTRAAVRLPTSRSLVSNLELGLRAIGDEPASTPIGERAMLGLVRGLRPTADRVRRAEVHLPSLGDARSAWAACVGTGPPVLRTVSAICPARSALHTTEHSSVTMASRDGRGLSVRHRRTAGEVLGARGPIA